MGRMEVVMKGWRQGSGEDQPRAALTRAARDMINYCVGVTLSAFQWPRR
jgi:hypothetical protein